MNVGEAKLRIEEVRLIRSWKDRQQAEILKGVSLCAAAGDVTVIFGPSGGGKSTLIRLLNRLEDPTAGRILLDGEEIAGIDPLRLRRRVGLVQQKPFMFEGTVLENLRCPFLLRGETPPEEEEILAHLDLCGLSPEILHRDARTLSLGQQQRVSLARILVTGPEVLLLDEPTSALDRPTGDRLAAVLKEICRRQALTLVMVTHDLRLAEKIADRLVYLEDGRVLEEGSAAELLGSPRSAELRRFLAEPLKAEGVMCDV